ncbi:hypothetical protein RhiLY_04115 [Ceratobasidium sp. AG-Ba]|nr:hypothetical protein RhiLY_04115 [Ceratobasidium sp. AG-Ba]
MLATQSIPSSTGAKVAFGLGEDSDEEPTLNLPDAAPRSVAPLARHSSTSHSRLTTWASHEGNNPRVSLRGVQGASVTGHNKTKSAKTKGGNFARPTVANASSSGSNKLSRLGSKASGFA